MRNNLEIAKHSIVNRSFETGWSNMIYRWEGNLLEIKIIFGYLENIWFRDFLSSFREHGQI